MTVIEDQTMALAGIFQSAALIEQLAYQGELNQAAYDCSLDSLFTFDAPTAVDVFGDLAGLSRGLRAAAQYLGGENQKSGKNVAYYVLSMLKLSLRLIRNQEMADTIQTGLQTIATRADDFEMSRASLVSKIDGLYQDTVSTLNPRIMVRGEQIHLTNPDNAGKIRVLLLAGIRAAVLWHQLGGSKWKLVISRKKYVRSANQILMRI
jgi:high frequency lysogenization protein